MFTLVYGLVRNYYEQRTHIEVIKEPADRFDDEGILFQLAAHYGVSPEEVRVEYRKKPTDYQNKFASGLAFSSNFDNGQSGQNFIAAKVYAGWITIILSSGIIPLCSEIEVYNFPKELLSGCLDQNGKLIHRISIQ